MVSVTSRVTLEAPAPDLASELLVYVGIVRGLLNREILIRHKILKVGFFQAKGSDGFLQGMPDGPIRLQPGLLHAK